MSLQTLKQGAAWKNKYNIPLYNKILSLDKHIYFKIQVCAHNMKQNEIWIHVLVYWVHTSIPNALIYVQLLAIWVPCI